MICKGIPQWNLNQYVALKTSFAIKFRLKFITLWMVINYGNCAEKTL